MTAKRTPTSKNTPKINRSPRRKSWWALHVTPAVLAIGRFLMTRARDLALVAIVGGAFVAVFDGSLYSAREFGFHGWSAYAFAVMPDALMVICAAKQRQAGVTAAQWAQAHKWMQFAFRFSLVTNMIAASLRHAPAEWINSAAWGFALFTGAVIYHGVVVWFLKGAVDVLTTVRADRKAKGTNASEPAAVPAVAPVVNTATVSWSDTILANAMALVRPMGRKA